MSRKSNLEVVQNEMSEDTIVLHSTIDKQAKEILELTGQKAAFEAMFTAEKRMHEAAAKARDEAHKSIDKLKEMLHTSECRAQYLIGKLAVHDERTAANEEVISVTPPPKFFRKSELPRMDEDRGFGRGVLQGPEVNYNTTFAEEHINDQYGRVKTKTTHFTAL